MGASSHSFSPFIPDDDSLSRSGLPDLARELDRSAARLASGIAAKTRQTLARHLQVINSYYSNLIEGNHTLPHEIRAAQQGDYSTDPVKRHLQQESVAHIRTQEWLRNQSVSAAELFRPEFFRSIHATLYHQIPDELRQVTQSNDGEILYVEPGQWRTRLVSVGRHVAPAPERLADLMSSYCSLYTPDRYGGDRKIIAVMAAHHRFAWIHPFLDGNGRVGRLITDTALTAIGVNTNNLWCLSRGLARSANRYKELLARADFQRQGNHDGRGLLSQNALIEFCQFMLETAIDQIDYLRELLQLEGMHKRIDSYLRARNDGLIRERPNPIKPEASRIIHAAFLQGEIARADAIALCGGSERSGRRLLQQLREEELLSETSSRSPLSWEIPAHAEQYYFPELAPR
jgi:Fic family protein